MHLQTKHLHQPRIRKSLKGNCAIFTTFSRSFIRENDHEDCGFYLVWYRHPRCGLFIQKRDGTAGAGADNAADDNRLQQRPVHASYVDHDDDSHNSGAIALRE